MSRKIEVEIVADAARFGSGMRSASKEAEGFGSRMGGVAKAGMLAFAGAGLAVGAALTESVKAAMDAQVSQANLEQSLRRTHQSVRAMTPALEEAAGTSRRLGFTDEDTARALAKLEIATGSTKASISDLSVAQDLARTRHIDLSTASNALATAMTGSQRAAKQLGIIVVPVTTHLDALKRSHENLKTETGKLEVAHAKLLDKMATGNAVVDAVKAKVLGQAKAYSETAAGGMARFHAQVENLQVKIGTALLPALSRAADMLSKFVDWLQQSPAVARIAAIAMQVLGDVIHTLVAAGELLLGWYQRHKTAAQAIVAVLAAVALALSGPIVIIGALGVALIELYKRSETFRDAVNAAFKSVQDTIANVMPTIKAIIAGTISTVESLWKQFGGNILSFLSATWANVKQVLTGAFNVIEGLFKLFTDLLHGRWSKVWEDIKQIVSGAWNMIEGEFRQVVNVLGLLASTIGKVILHGIENELRDLASDIGRIINACVNAVRNLISAAMSAAKALGLSILHGITDGLAALPGVTARLITDLAAGLGTAALAAIGEAAKIGEAIVTGILSGLGNIVSSVGGAIAHGVGDAIGWAKNNVGSTADEVTHREIGVPMAQGVIDGFILGSATLPSKMTQTLQNAISAARTVITAARGAFGDAWQQLTNDALAAFDAATNRLLSKLQAASDAAVAKLEAQRQKLTPAEQQLQTEDASRAEAARQEAIAAAQAAMNAAMGAANSAAIDAATKAVADAKLLLDEAKQAGDKSAIATAQAAYDQARIAAEQAQQASGGDPAAIAAAQKQLDDALYAEHRAALEAQAQQERTAEDAEIAAKEAKVQKGYAAKEKELQAQRDLERRHFEQHLAELEAQLEREGATHKRAQDKIIRLLNSYGVSYKQAGKDLGQAFARGLDESAGAVEKSASALAAIVAKYLKTNSPSELGAMSDLPSWWKGFAPALVSGLDSRMISGTVSQAATPAAFMTASGTTGGGGGIVNVFASDYTGDVDALAIRIRDALKLHGFLNVGVGLS